MPSVSEQHIAQLCRALRTAGLPVGIEEELRLHVVLAGLDIADPTQLVDVLAAIVLKSPRQRPDFDRVVSAWAQTQKRRIQVEREPSPDTPSMASRPQRRWGLWGIVAVVGIIGLLCTWYRPRHEVVSPSQDLAVDAALSSSALDLGKGPVDLRSAAAEIEEKPPENPPSPKPHRVSVFVPHFEVTPVPIPKSLWAYLGMLLFATGIGIALRRFLRRPLLPTAEPLPTRRGPLQLLPAPVSLTRGTTAMLSQREQEIVVWGIGRFVSEEPSPRLDLRSTIAATCESAGQPQLRYQRLRHSREVWLWTDTSLGAYADGREAGVMQLSADLRAALGQAGLPLEEASYHGLPDRLLSAHGPFAPSEVDERRDAAMVLLLTDGRLLSLALSSGADGVSAKALLRQLSHWPQLAFVDCGNGVYRLRELLSPFGLAVINPSDVPGFLGGTQSPRRQPDSASDLHTWIAVCALSPFPLDDETALALRQKLRLAVSPWAIQAVRSAARSQGSRFVLPQKVRAEKLHWLCTAEDLYRQGHIPKDARLGQALVLYRDQLEKEDRQHRCRDALTPYVGTPAEKNLQVQKALLDLWDQPEQAARDLFRLSHSSQAGHIKAALGARVSAEYLDEAAASRKQTVTILPWRFDRLTPTARVLLQRLGLGLGVVGYKLRPVTLAPAARQKMAWAACAGLVVTALVGTVNSFVTWLRPTGQPVLTDSHRPDGGTVTIDPVPNSRDHQVSAQYAFVTETQRVSAGAQVSLTWEADERDPPDAGSHALLDLGVDLASPPDLAIRDMTVVVEEARDLGTVPTVPALGAAAAWSCPYEENTIQGVVCVKVCGGDFVMGSADDDREAESDERPAHPVHVDTFWIGKYEVSNEQYRKKEPGHKSTFDGDNLPVQDVDWKHARSYCRSIGGDLPTEAEWEYAARGPEGRKYPWGKAEPQPGRATFNRRWNDGPAAIEANPKGRGPFGTLNQAGNIDEWVTDCYDVSRYAKRKAQSDQTVTPKPVRNPVDDWPVCERRVLRGGPFWVRPQLLRSSLRNWKQPVLGSEILGFRCVRDSGRQR